MKFEEFMALIDSSNEDDYFYLYVRKEGSSESDIYKKESIYYIDIDEALTLEQLQQLAEKMGATNKIRSVSSNLFGNFVDREVIEEKRRIVNRDANFDKERLLLKELDKLGPYFYNKEARDYIELINFYSKLDHALFGLKFSKECLEEITFFSIFSTLFYLTLLPIVFGFERGGNIFGETLGLGPLLRLSYRILQPSKNEEISFPTVIIDRFNMKLVKADEKYIHNRASIILARINYFMSSLGKLVGVICALPISLVTLPISLGYAIYNTVITRKHRQAIIKENILKTAKLLNQHNLAANNNVAADMYNKLVSLFPSYEMFIFNTLITRLTEIASQDNEVNYLLGLFYQAAGSTDKAVSCFEKIEENSPNFAEAKKAIFDISQAAFIAKDYKRAKQYLEKLSNSLNILDEATRLECNNLLVMADANIKGKKLTLGELQSAHTAAIIKNDHSASTSNSVATSKVTGQKDIKTVTGCNTLSMGDDEALSALSYNSHSLDSGILDNALQINTNIVESIPKTGQHRNCFFFNKTKEENFRKPVIRNGDYDQLVERFRVRFPSQSMGESS